MARLLGPIQLDGRLGNLSFFQNREGAVIVRTPGGPPKGAVNRDPRFIRTRENCQEFGRAQRAATLFRNALKEHINPASDSGSFRRLHALLLRILKLDTQAPRGQRTVGGAAVKMLEGFNFNRQQPFTATFTVPVHTVIDRNAGVITCSFHGFVPSLRLVAPEGATHWQILAVTAVFDFNGLSYETTSDATEVAPLDDTPVPAGLLQPELPESSELPIVVVLGVRYFTGKEAGSAVLMKDGSHSLMVACVDTV